MDSPGGPQCELYGSQVILADRIIRHVEVLAGLLGERNTRAPSALDAARAHIRRELQESGYTVESQDYQVMSRTATNLEAVLLGRHPQLPELVVGAHYDSAMGTPGADDNASAVAALLEIARELSGRVPRRTIRFVCYDTEEPPYFNMHQMGSQHHAARCRLLERKLVGMICLESIGYFGKPQPAAYAPRWAAWLVGRLGGRHVIVLSNLRSVPFLARFMIAMLRAGWWRGLALALPGNLLISQMSDHRGYWEQKYRALMVTDTALLRNPNYHEASDLPATLDFPMLTRLTECLGTAIWMLAR
jgi:hypothetical protein